MAQFPNIFNCDLHSGPVSASIRQMYLGDIAANRVGVRVTDNGEAVALSGTCSGTAMLYNGGTVALTGVVDGNVAYVDLPAAVYSVEGPLQVFVTLTQGDNTTTLLEMRSNVTRTETGTVIDPGTIISSVAALISDIEDAVASIPEDYSELSADVVQLKSDMEDVQPAVETLGDEVADLRGAFVKQQENHLPFTVVPDEYVIPNGESAGDTAHEDGWDRTDFIPLENVYSMTVSADQASGYNCYYKADKTFRAQIAVTTTPTTIYPPSDAAYAIFSFSRAVMATFDPTFVPKTDHQIEVNKALAVSGTGSVISSDSQFVAPYDDCNTLVNNTVVTILANPVGHMAHIPSGFNGGTIITVNTIPHGTIEAAQIAIRKDGQIYTRHNYSGWTDWIEYAHSGLALEGAGKLFSSSSDLVAPYDDCDTFPNNKTITIIENASALVDNLPTDFTQGTIFTLDASATDTIAKTQIAVRKDGSIATRHKWGDSWSAWFTPALAEAPLYTEFSMFPDFAVIGDSFASGTILTQQGSIWGMYPDYSWPEMLSRMTGSEVANYSHSGLSARTWLTDSDGLTAMLADSPRALYLLCLGINDGAIYNEDSTYLGSVADMKQDYTQNPDTFYGNYGKIIGNIKTHAPNASIIMIAPPTYNTSSPTWLLFQSAIAEIAETAEIPFIAGHADPYFNSSFFQTGQAVAHPIAITYSGMAKAYKRQVEITMQNNPQYFWNVH